MISLKDNLNTHFSKQFDGLVWKIEIDEACDIAALEIRHPGNKETSFTCIDLPSQTINFENLRLEEPWFCGIETISEGMLLLHYYVGESSPEHKGIIAFDGQTGKKRWEHYHLTFAGNYSIGFKAFNPMIEPHRYIFLDKNSGEQIPHQEEKAQQVSRVSALKFPFEAYASSLPKVLQNENLVDEVEYLKLNQHDIYSVYVNEGQTLTNKIYVFNEAENVIWTDILLTDIQKKGFDTFFVYKNYLMYIKNRTEFVCYFL